MNWKTTSAGLLAALALLASALAEEGPWTVARSLRVLCAAGIAFLGVVARDALPVLPPPPTPPPPPPPPSDPPM